MTMLATASAFDHDRQARPGQPIQVAIALLIDTPPAARSLNP